MRNFFITFLVGAGGAVAGFACCIIVVGTGMLSPGPETVVQSPAPLPFMIPRGATIEAPQLAFAAPDSDSDEQLRTILRNLINSDKDLWERMKDAEAAGGANTSQIDDLRLQVDSILNPGLLGSGYQFDRMEDQ